MNDYVLDLSLDAVRLFERKAAGLIERGAISLSEPHVADRLGDLRREIQPDGALAVDVVIPDSQILYLRLSPESAEPEGVAATLERTAPYPLEELAWSVEPGRDAPCLAATTRQTLSEARDFATSNGFEPQRILAHPSDDGFPDAMTFEDAPDAVPAATSREPDADREATAPEEQVDGGAAEEEISEAAPAASIQEAAPAPEAGIAAGLGAEFLVRRSPSSSDRGARAVDPRLGRTRPIRPRQREAEMAAEDAAPPPEPKPAADAKGFGRRHLGSPARRKPLVAAGLAGLAVVALGGALAVSLGDSDAPPPESVATESSTPPDGPPADDRDIAALAPEPRGDPPQQERQDAVPEEDADEVELAVAEDIPAPEEPEPEGDIPPAVTDDSPDARPAATFTQDATAPSLALAVDAAEPEMVPEVVTSADVAPTPNLLTLMPLPAAAETAPEVLADPEPQITPEGGENVADEADAVDAAPVILSLPEVVDSAPQRTSASDGLGAPRLGFAAEIAGTGQATAIPEEWIPPEDEAPESEEALQIGAQGPQTRPQPRPGGGGEAANPNPAVEAAGFTSTAPETRPANFAALARQARADTSAVSTGSGTPQPSLSSGTPAGSPNVPVQPRTPSPASVTREATTDNAIRLNRINLVGVYGSSSDRRALIRLPSGRYQKVEVGDPLDGGQVQAIGSSELRYLKDGRSVSLSIPQG